MLTPIIQHKALSDKLIQDFGCPNAELVGSCQRNAVANNNGNIEGIESRFTPLRLTFYGSVLSGYSILETTTSVAKY